MKNIFFTLFLFIPFVFWSQERGPGGIGGSNAAKDTIKPPVTDYKIISHNNDTTFVDTSLTIHKEYRFNYLRRDKFELLPFSNTGQTYTSLSYNPDVIAITPRFGARARHFGFFEVEDIYYYNVPTPLTELYFKTVPEQGQQLDAFFSVNTSSRLNWSIAYKGVRALGRYQNILTSTGIFRTTLNYQTRNKRYDLKTHFVSNNLMNEENGGLDPLAMEQYINKEEEFEDRSLLEVNFEDAEGRLSGKRFYLDQKYHITNPETPGYNELAVGHILNFSDKKFQYLQTNARTDIFGESFETVNLRDEVKLENIYNEAYVNYSNSIVGELKFKAGLTNFNYGYNTVLVLEDYRIENRLIGAVYSAGGEYSKNIGGFQVQADAMINLAGEFPGNYLDAQASYNLDEENSILFGIKQSSQAPNFNFLLYQSNYLNYNWQNDFDNVNIQNLNFRLRSLRWANVEADLFQIQDYTYFGLTEESQVKPMQYGGQVRYFKLRAHRKFDFGRFAIDNTLMYQNILDGTDVLNLPDFVTRNSLYYKDHWFQKALYLQTGFIFKYFTDYNMDGYDPVLAEFYVQNEAKWRGVPSVDFFFNGKVQQTRVFFKLEHLNSLITGNNYFSAPGYPYTDFQIRFGLVWNFFM